MKQAKFFIFNFKEGGHNSVHAYSREEVVPTYERMNGKWFTIDDKTIRELDQSETDAYWDTYKDPDTKKWGKIPPREQIK